MAKLKNPFLLTGFYGKEYFCDREQEIQELMEHFNNERNVVLYSWRRLGKTALIKNFLSNLEENGNTEALYVDLLGTRDMASAVEQITQAVYERFGKTSTGFSAAFQRLLSAIGAQLSFDPVSGFPEFSIGLRQGERPERSLFAIGEFLQKRKKRIIIALDEFQQLAHYHTADGEAHFRSWMQNFPDIRFIFSGSHRQMMVSMFSEKNRPFYRSAQLMQLGAIAFESYWPFIDRHFKDHKKSIEQEAVALLYEWSRQQTYCIQLVCNKLFARHDEVTTAHLEGTYREILDQESPVFYNYSNLLTDTQWKVLLAVAKEEPLTNPLSKDFVAKHHLGASSSVNTALKTLVAKELVIREDKAYCIHDVLLTRWLQSL